MGQFEPGDHGRFKKLDRLVTSPGVCSFMRTHKEDWFLDTSLHADGLPGGAVCIGATAFRDMARVAGFQSEEDFELELERLEVAEARVHELESEMERFGQIFDELDRFGMLGDDLRNRVNQLRSPGVEVSETNGGNESASNVNDQSSSEPNSESGPDDSSEFGDSDGGILGPSIEPPEQSSF